MQSSNLTNYHSHSEFCDGHATMEDFVKAAIDAGFSAYGISSHAPLPYHTRWNMDADRLPDYLAEAQRLKLKYKDQIELYVGLEIDYLNEEHNPASEMFRALPLDYRIGSIHTIYDDNGDVHEISKPERFQRIAAECFGNDVRKMVEIFLDRTQRMVELGCIDIIGHTDKMYKLAQMLMPDLREQPWYKKRITELFELIASRGIMVEMNTKGYRKSGLFYPHASLYTMLHDMGIQIVVNSDVHYLDRINAGRAEGLALLAQSGYTHVAELHGGKWQQVEINQALTQPTK